MTDFLRFVNLKCALYTPKTTTEVKRVLSLAASQRCEASLGALLPRSMAQPLGPEACATRFAISWFYRVRSLGIYPHKDFMLYLPQCVEIKNLI